MRQNHRTDRLSSAMVASGDFLDEEVDKLASILAGNAPECDAPRHGRARSTEFSRGELDEAAADRATATARGGEIEKASRRSRKAGCRGFAPSGAITTSRTACWAFISSVRRIGLECQPRRDALAVATKNVLLQRNHRASLVVPTERGRYKISGSGHRSLKADIALPACALGRAQHGVVISTGAVRSAARAPHEFVDPGRARTRIRSRPSSANRGHRGGSLGAGVSPACGNRSAR